MKSKIVSVSFIGLFIASLASAQNNPANGLDSLLRDSASVFSRFEEVSAGLPVHIDRWTVPASLKKGEKEALSSVLKNVETGKPALNALLGKPEVSSADLLDAYAELVELASEL